jgi:hypothetical protein
MIPLVSALWLVFCVVAWVGSVVLISFFVIAVARRRFHEYRSRLAFWGVPPVLAAAGWTWQRLAYLHFLDHQSLKYGYFLTEAGKRTRLWLVTVPFDTVTIAMVAFWLVVTIVLLRRRAYWRVFGAFVWMLLVLLVFSLPSAYLDLQGSAAIFI